MKGILKRTVLIAIAIVVAAAVFILLPSEFGRTEPLFQGRPPSFWIAVYKKRVTTPFPRNTPPSAEEVSLWHASIQAFSMEHSDKIPFLVRAYQQSETGYERLVHWTYRWIGPFLPLSWRRDLNDILEPSQQLRSSIIRGFSYMEAPGLSILPVLKHALNDPSLGPYERASALAALSRFGASVSDILPTVLKHCQDADIELRERAIQAAVELAPENPKTISTLMSLLTHPTPSTRFAAVRALVNLDPQLKAHNSLKAVESALISILSNSDPNFFWHVSSFLEQIGPVLTNLDLLPTLLPNLSHTNNRVRGKTAQVIGQVGPSAAPAAKALEHALQDEHLNVRDAARAALQKILGTNAVSESTIK